MGKYSNYDEKEGVILTDLTGLTSSRQTVDEVIDEVIQIADSLPQKTYLVACWKNLQLDKDTADYYGQRLIELLQHVRGIVRYEATDVITRIAIRAETVKHNLQGAKANIFANKEEALEAIRKGRV